MSRITGKFVTRLADVWHRFELQDQDAESLAEMLAPMDDAGEVMAESIDFDMEPSDYLAGLESMAGDGKDS
jgi:hypothetical protein